MSAFSDIFGGGLFGDIFGERRRGPRPGPDLLMKLEIELVEAARGTSRTIEVSRQEFCTECRGSVRGREPRRRHATTAADVARSSRPVGFFRWRPRARPAAAKESASPIRAPIAAARAEWPHRPPSDRRTAGSREWDVAAIA